MATNPYRIPDPVTPKWYSRVYLKTQFWKYRRRQYLKQVGGRCEISNCTRPATEVHHVSYDNLYCERDPDLMALCRDCHAWMHTWPEAANDNKQLEFLFQKLEAKSS